MLIRKRKLTQNQSRRIQKNNQSTQVDDALLSLGVIVSHFGKQLDVQITDDHPTAPLQKGQLCRCHARTNLPMLSSGDEVMLSFDETANLGRIEILLPRTTLITRPDRYHKIKPVAANVHILAIVFAPLPKPSCELIDRYLVIAKHATVSPLLILNKADIATDDCLNIVQDYQNLGVPTIVVSSQTGQNIDSLRQMTADRLSVFAGQSGVGKSSLINLLLPHAKQNTNILSTNSKLGQHTTTSSRLLAYDDTDLTKGIIDTPGIREYGLWHLDQQDILQGFWELAPLTSCCQFRDCNHSPTAKGCALWQAQKDGQVLSRRIESLTNLLKEGLQTP